MIELNLLTVQSDDGKSRKFLFGLSDGIVEGASFLLKGRDIEQIICASVQLGGCILGENACRFCATGCLSEDDLLAIKAILHEHLVMDIGLDGLRERIRKYARNVPRKERRAAGKTSAKTLQLHTHRKIEELTTQDIFHNLGWKTRNLSSDEITSIIQAMIRISEFNCEEQIQISFMGQGEPLYNRKNVFTAMKNLDPRFTFGISTIGKVEHLQQVLLEAPENKDLYQRIRWQLSVHFANEDERKKHMPATENLLESLRLMEKIAVFSNRIFCANFAIFEGINDSHAHALEIAKLMSGRNAYVKISQGNSFGIYKGAPESTLYKFKKVMDQQGIKSKIFIPEGTELRLGCGQMRNFFTLQLLKNN